MNSINLDPETNRILFFIKTDNILPAQYNTHISTTDFFQYKSLESISTTPLPQSYNVNKRYFSFNFVNYLVRNLHYTIVIYGYISDEEFNFIEANVDEDVLKYIRYEQYYDIGFPQYNTASADNLVPFVIQTTGNTPNQIQFIYDARECAIPCLGIISKVNTLFNEGDVDILEKFSKECYETYSSKSKTQEYLQAT